MKGVDATSGNLRVNARSGGTNRCGGFRATRLAVFFSAVVFGLSGCAVGGDTSSSGDAAEEYPGSPLTILAPGSAGGGWDTRARALQADAKECGVTDVAIDVENQPGAGGTIGMASFVQHEGDSTQYMMMDTVTVIGGVIRNKSAVTLDDLTPIAGLTVATSAIVVPSNSPYGTLDELVDAFASDPSSVSWTGGSLGGVDHLMVSLLGKQVGLSADEINYVATGGGGETLSLLLSGGAQAGASTLTELRGQIESGDLRVLAVTGDERVDGIDAPTLDEAGYGDAEVLSIGGVMAPPGVSAEDRAKMIDFIGRIRASDCWTKSLESNDWTDHFVTGDEFGDAIKQQEEQLTSTLEEIGLSAD